jgi:hypothetical protein
MNILAWIEHLPEYALVVGFVSFVTALVKFGSELTAFLNGVRTLRKPPEQPTLADVRPVERTLVVRSRHSTLETLAKDVALPAGAAAGAVWLAGHHHAEAASKVVDAASVPSLVEPHAVASNVFDVNDGTVLDHLQAAAEHSGSLADFFSAFLR